MAFTSPANRVNPLLGVYFGIITSCMVGLVLLLMIFDRLGMSDTSLRNAMLLFPFGFYGVIAFGTFSREPADFYVSGRRVPAFFNGLVLAITTVGGTGIAAMSGALFLIGFDALCVYIGMIGGLVAMAILIAPFLRKFGASTLPGFVTHRFRSPLAGITASAVMAPALILLLVAELSIAARLGSWLTSQPMRLMVGVMLLVMMLSILPGGSRSQSWTGVAKAILAALALLAPTIILAAIVTNLPLPQLSHGTVLRALGRAEFAQGMPISLVQPWAFDLPDEGLQFITKRFANPFGSVGVVTYVLVSVVVMAGVAASPSLLMRAGTTTSVYETRKSLGWAVFVTGCVIMTLSAAAVFLRNFLAEELSTLALNNIPHWLRTLTDAGLVAIDANVKPLGLRALALNRDALVMVLPMASEMPTPIVYFALAGGIAAALAAGSQCLLALASIISEDVFYGSSLEPGSEGSRMMISRAAIVLVAILAGWMVAFVPLDPIDALLWSLTLTASVSFPVLVLAIWWKRITAWGAVAAMAAGFLTACIAILGGETQVFAAPGVLAAIFAMPVGFTVAVAISLLTTAPARSVLELVRDLRVPGGEAIMDREARLLRQKQR
jgi:cation/acetate symporter